MRIHRTVRATGVGLAALLVSAIMAASASAYGGAPPFPAHIYGTPGHGCPPGALCIYPTSDDFRTGPEAGGMFFSYGAHNLHGQYGRHLVYNNQYPVNGVDAGASFCEKYNGTGGAYEEMPNPGAYSPVWLTPVNSVTLWLYEYQYDNAFECTL